jgi:hypothetical protein
MSKTSARTGRIIRSAGILAAWLACATVWAGIQPPLYVGNVEPVRDQYGRPMIGSYAPDLAHSRSRVELRTAADGVIRPPAISGAAHPANPMLTADSVGGIGMNAAEANCGLFCMVFSERPATGTKIFARAFNAPSLAEATFYADSAVLPAPAGGTSMVLTFGPARPLDAADADGDGLANSWEKAMGIDDRLTDDYDGDGMSDYHEMLAGTAADDPGSLLAFRSIKPEAATAPAGAGAAWTKPVRVKWQSVPGKRYRLQYVPDLKGEQVFIDVGDLVTAGDGEYEIEMLVDVPDGAVAGAFRVKLAVTE